MGRYSGWPPLIDELKYLSVSMLRQYGYLNTGHRSGNITWYKGKYSTGDINLQVTADAERGIGFMEVFYRITDGPSMRYTVVLKAIPTNLGIGKRWYFHCPFTGKRCTKLHYHNGKFLHRTGIPGGMYATQTESHKTRQIRWLFDACFALSDYHAQSFYRGKPTKKMLMLKKRQAGILEWLNRVGDV